MTKLETAYIGLGGNVGDVVKSMSQALQMLNDHEHIEIRDISQVYKTPPWGLEEQDWFFNACASLQTKLSPDKLLALCLETENKLSRTRDIRWGPRTIDLDVLTYGNETIVRDNLQVPHPRMCERAFVLKPLSDIAHDLQISEMTVVQHLEKLDTSQIELTQHRITL